MIGEILAAVYTFLLEPWHWGIVGVVIWIVFWLLALMDESY